MCDLHHSHTVVSLPDRQTPLDNRRQNFVLFPQMYLPSEYLWGLVNGSEDEDGNTKGSASLPPLMPPYSKAGNVSDEG